MLQYIRQISTYAMMAFCTLSFAAEDARSDFNVKQVTQLDGIPWGMAQLNDDQLLVTLLKGQLVRVDLNSGESTNIDGVPRVARFGQGGLLDIALAPDFDDSKWVYITYAKATDEGATTALGRGQLKDNTLQNWQNIFVADASSSRGQHFGSRIAFDDSGHVFMSIGDRGKRGNAQDLKNHAGTIVRLNLDGSVPKDNPYVRHGNIHPEIWSFGHRNPQGLFFDRTTGQLWSNEHGPRGGDEINLIRVGANYGWPIVSSGKEYWAPLNVGDSDSREGMENPTKVFVPSIAPSSLLIYRGNLFKEWDGDFLSTALALRHLNNVKLSSGKVYETRFLEDLDERLRDVIEANDGALLISTDSGRLLRVTPAS